MYKELAEETYRRLFFEELHILSRQDVSHLKKVILSNRDTLPNIEQVPFMYELANLIKREKIDEALNQKRQFGRIFMNSYEEIQSLYDWIEEQTDSVQIGNQTEVSVSGQLNKTPITDYFKYKPKTNVITDYLNELKTIFDFTEKLTLGGVCLALFERNLHKKEVKTFSKFINILADYWGVKLPKDKRKNKYEKKKNELIRATAPKINIKKVLPLSPMERAISSYFSSIPDPRVEGRCLHKLSDILLIAVCTYLTGGSDYQDMHVFAKERGSQLPDLLELANGAPSADTFERVFQRLEVSALQTCLETYGKEVLAGCLSEKQIVLDGKKLKGVSPTSRGNSGLYILNAWVSENRFCTGQQRVEDKSNEITAIPKVLNSLDITDAVVSIDAIGTQKEIAKQIVEQGGHYLLSVKGNQKGLLEDVESAFRTRKGSDQEEIIEKDHGRIEIRRCSILPAKDFLLEETVTAWKNVTTLVKIEASREIKGVKHEEIRYYISDEAEGKASYYNALARGHWSIENQLHWHLDVTFKEDACRAREGNAPENLSTIRKLALQIISNAKDKHSLKKRQYKAALDIGYMKKLINF
jgi:predicted transposase YbfD/YdcC